MKTIFEIGKKYVNSFFGTTIYECKYIGKQRAFIEDDNGIGAVPPIDMDEAHKMGWREHKEPVVHKKTIIWYRPQGGGDPVISHNQIPPDWMRGWGYEILKVEEVTYTEGE